MDLARGTLCPPVARFRLHLGAHKTATTHIQQTLNAMRDTLSNGGVDFCYYQDLRTNGFPSHFRTGTASAKRMKGRLDLLRSGQPCVLVSDENWIGGMGDALAPDPYPDLRDKLRGIAPLYEGRVEGVFFAIRNMADCLPSAYAEALRFHTKFVGFERYLRARMRAGGSWVGVIERLRAAFPGIPITVWRYEDYRGNAHSLLNTLTGLDLPAPPDLREPARTRSPSASAIAAIETLSRKAQDRWRYMEDVQRALAADTDTDKYRPLSPEDMAWFTKRYENDVNQIAALPEVTLLHF